MRRTIGNEYTKWVYLLCNLKMKVFDGQKNKILLSIMHERIPIYTSARSKQLSFPDRCGGEREFKKTLNVLF